MIPREHLGRAISCQNEQTRRLRSSGNRRNQFEGREIAPMEIFKRDYERGVGGEGFQRLCHLAQHPLLGNTLHRDLQSFTIAVA